jgi:sulfatase maturation enzyme AslB (radical SAM superfamily)
MTIPMLSFSHLISPSVKENIIIQVDDNVYICYQLVRCLKNVEGNLIIQPDKTTMMLSSQGNFIMQQMILLNSFIMSPSWAGKK